MLGLPLGASKSDIKRAYRKLALKYHPDRNPSPAARERFIAITKAYDYLMDPPKISPAVYQKQAQQRAERAQRQARAESVRKARMRYAAYKKMREIEQGRAYSQALTFLIAVVCLGLAAYFGSKYFNYWYVHQNPAETVCRVINFNHNSFTVKYVTNSGAYTTTFSGGHFKNTLLSPNGMPVMIGCEFLVIYNKDNPTWCELDDEKITQNTLKKYIYITSFEIAKQHNIKRNNNRVECLALQVYHNFGVDGLADLYFWKAPVLENISNNSRTYKSLLKNKTYQRITQNCLLEK